MEDIYGQGEFERNSIVSLPEGYAKKSGDTLYSWLGSIWRTLNKGDGMVRGLQAARGIRMAQLYLDVLEAAKLQDRNGAPVFHRELWHPIVVRRSQRDSAQENMLSIGMDGEIGPQPEGSVYGEGTVFRMGKMANFADFVTYPLSSGISGGAMSIVDNIVNPKVVLKKGDDADFVIRNNTIVFRREDDPLSEQSPFEKFDIPGSASDDPEDADVEAVLWASDVLFDRNYIADHLSYALGADAPSSDVVKRILNAAWSSVASGLTPELVKTLMAAMLNIPVIQNKTETVIDISRSEDATLVRTNAGVYKVSPKATLRMDVYSGAVLKRGDLLDESLRIYPFLNVAGAETDAGFSVPLEQDIPSIPVPRDILRAKTEHGVYVMWGETVVKRSASSPSDANGMPHLYFDIGGSEDDVSAFWNDVWAKAEEDGVSMESYLGPEGSPVSPAEFFVRNLVGANTIFAVVDRSQADDTSMMRDPMFFDMLNSVVPSAVRLFLVEHIPAGLGDEADMGSLKEREFLSAALPEVVECVPERPLPGLGGRGPSFGEYVRMRLVRPAPEKARGRRPGE